MTITNLYYRPSGRFSSSVFRHALVSLIVAVAVAWVYAWCAAKFASFFVFFLPFIACFVYWVVCDHVVTKGHLRNIPLTIFLSLLICLCAWYTQWIFWAALKGSHLPKWPGLFDFLMHPGALLVAVIELHPGFQGVLAIVFEFLLLVIAPTWLAQNSAGKPYCESTRTWGVHDRLERRFDAIDKDLLAGFIAALEADPDNFRTLLQDSLTDPSRYTTLSIHTFPAGPHAYLSVHSMSEITKDGKVSGEAEIVVKQLRISAQVAQDAQRDCTVVALPGAAGQPGQPTLPAYLTQDDDEQGDDEQEDDAPTPAELEPALAAMHAGDFEEALAGAAPFCQAVNAQLCMDANRLSALCCSRLEKWDDAANYWEALFAHEGSAHNCLQIATSKVMAGYLADGEQWLSRTITLNRKTDDITAILIHTNFISALKRSGYLRAALPYLEWVKQVYETASNTDPTFLTLRGVPFFDAFLEQSASIVDASMDAAQAQAWYSSMLAHIDAPGRDTLTAWLAQRAGAR